MQRNDSNAYLRNTVQILLSEHVVDMVIDGSTGRILMAKGFVDHAIGRLIKELERRKAGEGCARGDIELKGAVQRADVAGRVSGVLQKLLDLSGNGCPSGFLGNHKVRVDISAKDGLLHIIDIERL